MEKSPPGPSRAILTPCDVGFCPGAGNRYLSNDFLVELRGAEPFEFPSF
jgi:hypothetical protein